MRVASLDAVYISTAAQCDYLSVLTGAERLLKSNRPYLYARVLVFYVFMKLLMVIFKLFQKSITKT